MKKLLLFAFFIWFGLTYAQTLGWAKRMGSTGNCSNHGMTIDNNGNIYTTGEFVSNMDFNPDDGGDIQLTSTYSSNIFITKHDSAGNYIWTKNIDGNGWESGYSIDTDQSGNIYVTGWFDGPTDFDPGSGTFILPVSYAQAQIFVLKLDPDGNFIWVKSFHGNAGINEGHEIKVSDNYKIFVAGTYSDTVDFDPGPGIYQLTSNGENEIFVMALDSAGNFIWASSMGGPGGDVATALDIDTNKNIFISGLYSDFADFDPGSDTVYLNTGSPSQTDVFIAKLDSIGNLVWAKSFLNTNDDFSQHLVLGDDGSVYKSGRFGSTTDFDPGVGVHNLTTSNTYDLYVLKLDGDGNFVWVKQMVGTEPAGCSSQSIEFDGNFIYTIGFMEGLFDFDPNAGNFNLYSPNPYGVFISVLDTSGTYAGAGLINATGYNVPTDLKLDPYRNLYFMGRFTETMDLDSMGYTYQLSALDSSGNLPSLYIIKLNNHNIGIENIGNITYILYPNPSYSTVNMMVETDLINAKLIVSDINGKTLLQKNQLNGKNFQIDLSELNAGMYFFHLYSEGKKGVIKVVKN